jgi:sugar O-acyltransferase (sialic acid O-acetyltransferase NeuD family)
MVVADIVRLGGAYDVAGFLDDQNPARRGTEYCGAKVLGGREQLEALRAGGVSHIIMGFGDCEARLRLADYAIARGFNLPVLVHPKATVARDVAIGRGTVITAGAVLSPGVRVGEGAIVNTGSTVDHESVLEDGVHLATGVHLAGKIHVCRLAWVGAGTTVVNRARIGEGAIVGAGSLVLGDVPPRVVAYGVPAKVIRSVDGQVL